jgi:glycosyltransferase involved in cell wall biosynthesis
MDNAPAYRMLEELTALRARHLADFERLLTAKRAQVRRAFSDLYDRIVFTTASFREYFERTLALPPDRTVVIGRGIDPAIGPAPAPRAPGARLRFLHIGTLSPRKGLGEVRTVFADPALVTRDDWELALHGGGEPRLLGNLLTRNPRVRYHGTFPPEQYLSILRGADVGLAPSHFETFHVVTREYLRAGLPVLGSTTFGIPDVVRDGVNGLLFAPGDAAGLRRAVLSLLDDRDLLARLSRGARDTALRTADEEIDLVLEQYRAVLASPRPAS